MFINFLKSIKSQKGISIITIIILIALVIAALNVYAYFEPNFQLSKFSVMYYLHNYNDNRRKNDLAKIKAAVDKYYDDHHDYPATDGWCGRIMSMMHQDVNEAIAPYFPNGKIPQDPAFGGTNKDYFYRKVDSTSYVLLAVLENKPSDSASYNYDGCYDWPGNGVYNYQVTGSI